MRRTLLSVVLLGIALAGCGGPSTKFTATWLNPEFEGREVKDVLVIGVAQKAANRMTFESALVDELNAAGVEAFRSHDFLPTTQQLEKEDVVQVVTEKGIDAVIVTRLHDINREEHYVPPTTTVYSDYGYPGWGSPYYGSYYGYYSYGYSAVTSPGYTYTDVTVILETNLYVTETEGIIWAGQSSTFNPDSVGDVILPTARRIVDEMVKEKLVQP